MQDKKQPLEADMEQWTGLKLEKEYAKAVMLPCLFNLYRKNIMWMAGLDESHVGIMFAGRMKVKMLA